VYAESGGMSEHMSMPTDKIRPSGQPAGQECAQDVAVCYLLRHGNPDRLYAAFLESLRRYPAGMPYRPVLIQKGFAPGFVHPLTMSWPTPDGYTPEIVEVSDEGYDLTAYRMWRRQYMPGC
jgi:hypothetical protein